jgi:hypothetical protein
VIRDVDQSATGGPPGRIEPVGMQLHFLGSDATRVLASPRARKRVSGGGSLVQARTQDRLQLLEICKCNCLPAQIGPAGRL